MSKKRSMDDVRRSQSSKAEGTRSQKDILQSVTPQEAEKLTAGMKLPNAPSPQEATQGPQNAPENVEPDMPSGDTPHAESGQNEPESHKGMNPEQVGGQVGGGENEFGESAIQLLTQIRDSLERIEGEIHG